MLTLLPRYLFTVAAGIRIIRDQGVGCPPILGRQAVPHGVQVWTVRPMRGRAAELEPLIG